MNRLPAAVIIGGTVLAQAVGLLALRPLVEFKTGRPLTDPGGQAALLGMKLGGFDSLDTGRPAGWLPQALFLALSAVLGYAALRAAPDLRPRLRTVLALTAAVLLAAGAADLLRVALEPSVTSSPAERFERMGLDLGRVPAAPLAFALVTCWLAVPSYLLVWLMSRHRTVREVLASLGQRVDDAPRVPAASWRDRRDAVSAALLPVLLLGLLGGRLLQHGEVRRMDHTSVTFDPDLWRPYLPPPWIGRLAGVLYPALRLRPLRTETTAGWLATLGVFAVLLLLLAVGLGLIAARVDGLTLARLILECWGVTVLASLAAAAAEVWVFGPLTPIVWSHELSAFEVAGSRALRFGTVWGWAPGLALAGMTAVLRRRRYGT
ncbi:hypothetical protein [Kitasatospora terrestris]|uniref:Integral membrane protein n=1 Tax=Kitasatospora terrestris TaxID=258051 RepID=A0ABP9E7V3_9ACTN